MSKNQSKVQSPIRPIEVQSPIRPAPIRAVEKQLITVEHHAYKITHDQSTSLPEED